MTCMPPPPIIPGGASISSNTSAPLKPARRLSCVPPRFANTSRLHVLVGQLERQFEVRRHRRAVRTRPGHLALDGDRLERAELFLAAQCRPKLRQHSLCIRALAHDQHLAASNGKEHRLNRPSSYLPPYHASIRRLLIALMWLSRGKEIVKNVKA